jgi:nudix-type nucleoside diphosphatase (YffH/AdpP family)
MKYKIVREAVVYDGHYQMKQAEIVHDTFNGGEVKVNRLCFERGDAVAIVLFEKDTNTLLFTNQFRYPTVKEGDGWLLEITAGSLDKGDTPEERIRAEVKEEVGYELHDIQLIYTFFVSPGGTSEQTYLYFAEVQSSDKVSRGGGVEEEQEDIQLLKISVEEAKRLLAEQKIRDAKTIIGLQWFFNRY